MRGLQKQKDPGLVLTAMAFAASKHGNQRRADPIETCINA